MKSLAFLIKAGLIGIGGIGILAIGFVQAAQAHTFPLRSDPRVGSEVRVLPSEVRIWFDADLEPFFSSIEVRDSKGLSVGKGDGHVDPEDQTVLRISLPPLPDGKYRVFWSAVSRDGHRTEGDFSFTIKVSP